MKSEPAAIYVDGVRLVPQPDGYRPAVGDDGTMRMTLSGRDTEYMLIRMSEEGEPRALFLATP